MPQVPFDVRADMVDDRLWIETSLTRGATVQLHATLELARNPENWMPRFYCLAGPPGSGKSALAQRVAKQAQRNVACRIAGEAVARGGRPDPHPTGALAEALRLARGVAGDFGRCPMACSPIIYHPVDVCEMEVLPGGKWYSGILRNHLTTPGNRSGDPLRRTSMALVDHADHLLNLSEAKQRLVLDTLMDRTDLDHRMVYVFIGGQRLAEALQRHGSTQLIELPALPDDAEFARVASMVFGPSGRTRAAELHARSAGCMGALLHVAALEGLSPPFGVPEAEILRLPAPTSP